MKSVLLSIRPKWCELIASGKKTIEVRKTRPKLETPFKCYIYETKASSDMPTFVDEDGHVLYTGRGQVIGEFVCDKVVRTCGWRLRGDTQQCAKRTVSEIELPKLACLTIDEIVDYAGSENREVAGWHISNLEIYEKPKDLSEFATLCNKSGNRCANCRHYLFDNDGLAGYRRWCDVCHRKPLARAPVSWCYVEVYK